MAMQLLPENIFSALMREKNEALRAFSALDDQCRAMIQHPAVPGQVDWGTVNALSYARSQMSHRHARISRILRRNHDAGPAGFDAFVARVAASEG